MILPVIAIIGAGHMGESLLSGLIASGHPLSHLYASDPNEERLADIRARWGVMTSTDNATAIKNASIVLFAVKPQHLKAVASPLADLMSSKKPLVISIAAGVRLSTLSHWLGREVAIVRAMPNMPALIQTGVTALYANEHVQPMERNLAESVLRSVGITVWLTEESQMDAVTALSGSGPAYFFYVMEAMQKAGVALGLSEEIARLLTIQTAFGASRMVLESDEALVTLRQQVTSKGGTTEQAIRVFDEAALTSIFQQAMLAACQRSEELALLLDGE